MQLTFDCPEVSHIERLSFRYNASVPATHPPRLCPVTQRLIGLEVCVSRKLNSDFAELGSFIANSICKSMLVDSDIIDPAGAEPPDPGGGQGIIWSTSKSSINQSSCATKLVPRMAITNCVRSDWFCATNIKLSWYKAPGVVYTAGPQTTCHAGLSIGGICFIAVLIRVRISPSG